MRVRSSVLHLLATREKAQRFRDMGFNAVKFGWAPMGGRRTHDIALVSQARKGLGRRGRLDVEMPAWYGMRKQQSRERALLATTTFSGSRSPLSPTTMRDIAGSVRLPTCVLPPEKKKVHA